MRLESYYNFVRHWEIHHHHKAARERNIQQFFEFLMDRNDIEVSNLQCLLMCGEKSFEQARRNLEKKFDFVIPLPRLAQAPPVLAKAFEWPFVPDLHHENETRHKETMAELSGRMIAALSAVNSEDRQSTSMLRNGGLRLSAEKGYIKAPFAPFCEGSVLDLRAKSARSPNAVCP